MNKVTILKKEQRQIRASIEAFTYELNTIKGKLNKLKAREVVIKERLAKRSKNKLSVTDHAKIQYLVRYKNLNVEDIDKQIVTDSFLKLHEQIPNDGEFPNGNGQTLVIKQGKIVTVI